MDFRKVSLTFACALVLVQNGANAANDLPRICFKSETDWLLYSTEGENPRSHIASANRDPDLEAIAANGGKPRKNDVVIDYTYRYENGMLTIDASSSKTPSGKIQFAWENAPESFSATDSKVSTRMGSSKSASIEVIVKDPVCNITSRKRLVAEVK